jgi:hypothetical protein
MTAQTHTEWMREQLIDATANHRIIPLTGHGSLTDPHTRDRTGKCSKCGGQK